MKEDIPDDYQVAVSKYNRSKYDVIAQAVGGALVEYAVAPTNMLTIGYRTKDAKGIITGHFLYNRILTANNKWYFILECPWPGYKEFKRRMDKQGAKE